MLIAIVDYKVELTKEIEEFETQWKLRETKHPQLVLTDKEEIVILELEKVRKAYEKYKDDKKIAKNLKKLGIKIEDIALATNLSEKEIKEL